MVSAPKQSLHGCQWFVSTGRWQRGDLTQNSKQNCGENAPAFPASWVFSSPLPQEAADESGVHVVVHIIREASSKCSPDLTFLFLCTAYTDPGLLGWRDQNVLLPPSLSVQPERKGLVLCVMVSALTLGAFWTRASYSTICLFRKAPLNNLVEMSDTSRPIYHNELQMPRMDNNGLFIRRQEQRRQEGSIYSLPPMAHSSFSLQEATKSFREP